MAHGWRPPLLRPARLQNQLGHFAASLPELEALQKVPAPEGISAPRIRLADDGFEARVTHASDDGTPRTLHVRADSRLW